VPDRHRWQPAVVPGTVADVLAPAEKLELDAATWDFHTVLQTSPARYDERLELHVGGIATVSEVLLNGKQLWAGASMFTAVRLDVTDLMQGQDELLIRCHPLLPSEHGSGRPRARWRTQLVEDGQLRHVRTALLGRAPGFAPGPPVVGPWRPVLLSRERALAVDDVVLLPRLDGRDGALSVVADLHGLGATSVRTVQVEVRGPTGVHRGPLELAGSRASGSVPVPDAARWWPHTHGEPTLYAVRLLVTTSEGEHSVDAGAVGFRTLGAPEDLDRDGLALEVNGVPVFARGAVWTPQTSGVRLPVEDLLVRARGAGMNLLRVAGTGVYEDTLFHDRCDALGLLVWQDLMFANLDYPLADVAFRSEMEQEATDVLRGLAGRPSTVVLCGGSEVEQQAAMLGVPVPRQPFYDVTLPRLAAEAGLDAVCLPSSPWGGELPFRTDRGVAHYFGVGAYLRPFTDARSADVRFASECLALSNVPDADGVEAVLPGATAAEILSSTAWAAGVPRDRGASWDFEQVRDHYLGLLYDVDADRLRDIDPEHYLALARATSGTVMTEVLGEWRRLRSHCAGAVLLWLTDLLPGAGWGVLDAGGHPKPVWFALRRILAPVAVWTTDEGLNGVDVHVANDGPNSLEGRLQLSLHREDGLLVDAADRRLLVPAHGQWSLGVETMLGHFADVSHAYRFGPPSHHTLAVTLGDRSDGGPSTTSLRLPLHWPAARSPHPELELEGRLEHVSGGLLVTLSTRRLAHQVQLSAPGLEPQDNWFDLAPGTTRSVLLRGDVDAAAVEVRVRAANLVGDLMLRR